MSVTNNNQRSITKRQDEESKNNTETRDQLTVGDGRKLKNWYAMLRNKENQEDIGSGDHTEKKNIGKVQKR